MKRMILTASIVLAVVGGALAFKATRVAGPLFCQTTSGVCTDLVTRYVLDDTAQMIYCNSGVDTDHSCTQHVKASVNP